MMSGSDSLLTTLHVITDWPISDHYTSLPIPPLASIQCPPPLSANPSTDLHSLSSTPLGNPPLASIQCPPPLSANPSTGLQSVSSTSLCQSLH
ncbi:unnamed protein product [Staurois parvus]|uniref:Uncharacterized protein n=1 Tax=Staurois parvus TaxID=386267 RepID=A0ABN9ETV7_9NEOB|nr:unnamed protein product [Staurois parvus]